MSSTDTTRHRRPHRKSRSGCQNCKRRKIKCDETTPECLKCTGRGIRCNFLSPDAASSEERLSNANMDSLSAPDSASPVGASAGPYKRDLHFIPSQYNAADTSESSDRTSEYAMGVVEEQRLHFQILSQRLASLESQLLVLNRHVPPPPLSYGDMELFHHYMVLTTPTVGNDEAALHFWRVRLPEIGLRHHHVLHVILGLAALHKARIEPHRRLDFLLDADRHYSIGLRSTALTLASIDEQDPEVVYVSAMLLAFYYLGLGPQPGQYLAFSNRDEVKFMSFLRGVRSIIGYQAASRSPETAPSSVEPTQNTQPASREDNILGHGYEVQFHKLRYFALESPVSQDVEMCLQALNELEAFFVTAYGESTELSDEAKARTEHPFAWLYRVSDEFLGCLQSKMDLALAIYSCFAVLLKGLDSQWVIQGWPEHIMSGVWLYLDIDHRDLVRWPMERIQWVPLY
ncbi:uncharacterized protein F5Z01DRAFT_658154 [Emericellopsis atlantica]|uniref:Zn(2)-C6 fungal-type domain-containing protein n=1 Tax=Emericellopsis atlantica TaxID=2614577 RepID=A0A9P8CN73_9HYPO|nr:uncharacterized protein F5Z01DRAFT_658154 [Emericellopsis atlantica]KAG9253213.1 hypothetical protein F5Z01DRAFT_658154 [Emericellopsis atlantica]